jgi:hypothetical protein
LEASGLDLRIITKKQQNCEERNNLGLPDIARAGACCDLCKYMYSGLPLLCNMVYLTILAVTNCKIENSTPLPLPKKTTACM